MTITPDQARELLDGATPSPWRFTECESIIPFRVDFWDDDELAHKNANLAAAAPDMAETIAGMTWQTGVHAGDEYIWAETPEEEAIAVVAAKRPEVRLVRRLVSDPEVSDGE